MGLLRFAPFLLLYAVAALLSLRATGHAASDRDRQFWRIVAITLGLLLVEKALEQSFLYEVTKLAVGEGWYGDRRTFQTALIGLFGAVGLVGAVALVGLGRSAGGLGRVAMLFVAALATFAVVRAVSLHEVDGWLAIKLGPLLVRHAIELSLLAIIALLAGWANFKRG